MIYFTSKHKFQTSKGQKYYKFPLQLKEKQNIIKAALRHWDVMIYVPIHQQLFVQFQILNIGWDTMNQVVVRVPQNCRVNRAMCIFKNWVKSKCHVGFVRIQKQGSLPLPSTALWCQIQIFKAFPLPRTLCIDTVFLDSL